MKGLYQFALGEKGLHFVISLTLRMLAKYTNHIFQKQHLTYYLRMFAQHIYCVRYSCGKPLILLKERTGGFGNKEKTKYRIHVVSCRKEAKRSEIIPSIWDNSFNQLSGSLKPTFYDSCCLHIFVLVMMIGNFKKYCFPFVPEGITWLRWFIDS